MATSYIDEPRTLEMKLPKMCYKTASFDNERAGWYVHNSIWVKDIIPEWRIPGGGVGTQSFSKDLNAAFSEAIIYTNQRIKDAERHLKMLEEAQRELWSFE